MEEKDIFVDSDLDPTTTNTLQLYQNDIDNQIEQNHSLLEEMREPCHILLAVRLDDPSWLIIHLVDLLNDTWLTKHYGQNI